MDQAAYQRWWGIHVRVARGEVVSTQERALYDSGRQDLEEDDKFRDVQGTREVREQLRVLEAERRQLEQRRQQLESEITVLEDKLQQQTRQLLGVEE